MNLLAIAVLTAALGCALVAGTFFAFFAFVTRALAERPPAEGMAAMVSINRVILRSAFIPLFLGTALLCVLVAVYAATIWTAASLRLLLAAGAYVVGSLGVTMAFNVPLNNRLDRAAPDDEAMWRRYLARWTLWNHVRTLASLTATGLFIGAPVG